MLKDCTMLEQIVYEVSPRGQLRGVIEVPGDKSISHRAVLLGAIANGTTHVRGFLHAKDTLATVQACQNLGIEIEFIDDMELMIQGKGLYGFQRPPGVIDCGNSGTLIRLLT